MSRQKCSIAIFNTRRGVVVGIDGNYSSITPASYLMACRQKKFLLTHTVWWFCVANLFNCFRKGPCGAVDKYSAVRTTKGMFVKGNRIMSWLNFDDRNVCFKRRQKIFAKSYLTFQISNEVIRFQILFFVRNTESSNSRI